VGGLELKPPCPGDAQGAPPGRNRDRVTARRGGGEQVGLGRGYLLKVGRLLTSW